MLRIANAHINDVTSLRNALQNALRLEHSTIPPYLCALMTLSGRSASVRYARQIIRDIVLEEMLHMALAGNLLNAIGGTPQINSHDFVLSYPGSLPMGVAGGLQVHLKRYSCDVVRTVFMEIEEPEIPLQIPVMKRMAVGSDEPQTIGEFYASIRAEIVRQGDELFAGADPARQVTTGFFGMDEEFAVSNVETAILAIDTIVEQGEGTPKSPVDLQGDIAHYYRFQELEKGMKLVADPASPIRFSFDPDQQIMIDETADVIQMIDDPQLFVFGSAHKRAAQLAHECDRIYSKMLNALHQAFNGKPEKLGDAIGTMFEFRNVAEELLQQPVNDGQFAGPCFRHVPV